MCLFIYCLTGVCGYVVSTASDADSEAEKMGGSMDVDKYEMRFYYIYRLL